MILEGGLISLACIVLTAFHAGPAFKETWNTANFKLRNPDAARGLRGGDGSGDPEMVGVTGGRKGVNLGGEFGHEKIDGICVNTG